MRLFLFAFLKRQRGASRLDGESFALSRHQARHAGLVLHRKIVSIIPIRELDLDHIAQLDLRRAVVYGPAHGHAISAGQAAQLDLDPALGALLQARGNQVHGEEDAVAGLDIDRRDKAGGFGAAQIRVRMLRGRRCADQHAQYEH